VCKDDSHYLAELKQQKSKMLILLRSTLTLLSINSCHTLVETRVEQVLHVPHGSGTYGPLYVMCCKILCTDGCRSTRPIGSQSSHGLVWNRTKNWTNQTNWYFFVSCILGLFVRCTNECAFRY